MQIVELKGDCPAFICRSCQKHVMQASELKKLCLKSDQYCRESLINERYLWHENLRELKAVGAGSVEAQPTDEPAYLNMSPSEFQKIIKEADSLLMQSLLQIENPGASEADATASSPEPASAESVPTYAAALPGTKEPNLPADQQPALPRETFEIKREVEDDAYSMTAETEKFESDSECNDFAYVDNISFTKEEIMEMTQNISEVLPALPVKAKRRKKKSRLTRTKKKPTKTINSDVVAPTKTEAVSNAMDLRRPPMVIPKQETKEAPAKRAKVDKCELCRKSFDDKVVLMNHFYKVHNPLKKSKRQLKKFLGFIRE